MNLRISRNHFTRENVRSFTSAVRPSDQTRIASITQNKNQDMPDSDSLIKENEATLLLKNDQEREEARKRDRQWLRSTISLCCVMLTQSYLLISVFPYSGFLALHLLPTLNQENVGSYAGFIASCFMFGRMISSFEWGKATDKYGRKFVIQATLILSAVFSVLFGLAPTFEWALLFRFMLGLSNGMVGSVKTILSEITKTDEEETKSMALVLGMWGKFFF